MAGVAPHFRKMSASPDEFDEKHSVPSLDTFNTLAPNNESNNQDTVTLSPSGQRADASKLNDDLELLRAERLISNQEQEEQEMNKMGSKNRSRTIAVDPDDAFNQPAFANETAPHQHSDAVLYRFWLFLKNYPRFIRYLAYLIPGAALLLIPVLLGALRFKNGQHAVGGVGGVSLMWFGIWLEIVWGSLWVSRMITSLMPHIFHGIAKMVGSINAKKWRTVGQELELHTALFLWFMAILISFKPTCAGHRVRVPKGREDEVDVGWIDIVNKVIIALFTLATLNWVEKICLQWIATSFHQRTYATRIENNKSDIRQLVHLFDYSKVHLQHSDSFWANGGTAHPSGVQTPMRVLGENARQVWGKVGHVANRVGNDFIGRKVTTNHPRKVVTELLRTSQSAYTLARLIYRSLIPPDRETVYLADMQNAFNTEEEAEAAFSIFDKDLNGDISMEEFEAVTNEIHLEKKAIAASLKDLDSVIQKLDKVLLFAIVVIAVIVFISILSSSAAAGLASAGTAVLGLAWMLQATAQEFLQSIIFVFVKHPFDVGDRVTVYGSTGANMTGDDYYVTEVSLLYTEFKKMQGHIVQAPNSLLNTLFILNQRRSNGLADPITLVMRFGTPAHMIEGLKARMLEFCLQNKRDYQPQIISEMTTLDSVRSCSMNIIFFHKSNFQNELLRLNRHNKFVTELMYQMVQIGIQAPYRIDPGGSREYPLYYTGLQFPPAYGKIQEHDNYASGPGPSHAESSYSAGQTASSAGTNMDNLTDFQDVFETRKEQNQVQRLASIREKDRGARKEEASEPRASTSGLAPSITNDSQARERSRLFGRARSRSKSQRQRQNEVV